MSDPSVTIAQVLQTLHVGGTEVLAARLARRLRDTYRFVFICLEERGTLGEQLRDEGFPVHCLDKRPGVDRTTGRRLLGVVRTEGVSVIHAHQYGPFFYASAGRFPRSRPPVIFTEHGRFHPDRIGMKRVLANRVLLRRGDRLTAVGEAVRRALVDKDGFPARRVAVIYNGIALSNYEEVRRDRAAVRRELGFEDGDLVAILVARLDPLKDHLTALRTLERVTHVRPEVRLVLVGDGPSRDEVSGAIRERGLEPFVRNLGYRADIPRLLGAADLGLLTSISEGIPLALIEAMAAGLPVVATRVGGVPEVVEEGRTGLLAPAGNDEELSGLILHLAADPALRERLGRAGRERAFEAFSEDRMAASYDHLYRELAATGGSSRAAHATTR